MDIYPFFDILNAGEFLLLFIIIPHNNLYIIHTI